MNAARFPGWIVRAIPVVIIAVFAAVACVKLNFPAIHYDEAFYVNSAVHADETTFRTQTIGPFPVIIMPYIGALKAYVLFPIFALFDVSQVSMRLPMILIMSGALYLLYTILRKRLGVLLASSILLVTAWNASFIIFTRLDFGPVVLDFLLKIIALYLLLRFVKNPRPGMLTLFWAVLFLGVFNKLNFIWYANAFIAGLLLVWGRQLWRQTTGRDRWRYAAISAAGFAACIGYSLYITITYHLEKTIGLVDLQYVKGVFEAMLQGSWFYNYAFSAEPLGSRFALRVFLAIVLIGGLLLFVSKLKKRQADERLPAVRTWFMFSGVVVLALLAQLTLTKSATAGWHYFSLFPFLGILFVLSLYAILSRLPTKRHLLRTSLLAGLVLLVGLYHLNVYRSYIKALDKPTINITWSPAISRLVEFAKTQKNAQFVSIEWGTHVQLLVLDRMPGKYVEQMGPLMIDDPVVNRHLYETYLIGKPNAFYITYAGGPAVFPSTKMQFLAFAEGRGYEIADRVLISDDEKPIFELFRLQPKAVQQP